MRAYHFLAALCLILLGTNGRAHTQHALGDVGRDVHYDSFDGFDPSLLRARGCGIGSCLHGLKERLQGVPSEQRAARASVREGKLPVTLLPPKPPEQRAGRASVGGSKVPVTLLPPKPIRASRDSMGPDLGARFKSGKGPIAPPPGAGSSAEKKIWKGVHEDAKALIDGGSTSDRKSSIKALKAMHKSF